MKSILLNKPTGVLRIVFNTEGFSWLVIWWYDENYRKVNALVWRQFKRMVRDPLAVRAKLIECILIAVFYGVMFYRTPNYFTNPEDFQYTWDRVMDINVRSILPNGRLLLTFRVRYWLRLFSSLLCLLLWSLYGLWRSGPWFNAKYRIQFIRFLLFTLLNLSSHKYSLQFCHSAMQLLRTHFLVWEWNGFHFLITAGFWLHVLLYVFL